MKTFKVGMYTGAFATVEVEVEDDATEDQIIEQALSQAPQICAHCSGFSHSGFSLELGDEWDIAENPAPGADPTPDIREVIGEDDD